MNIQEIKELAENKGVKPGKMKKDKIVRMIQGTEGNSIKHQIQTWGTHMTCPKCKANVGIQRHHLNTNFGQAVGLRCYLCGYWFQEFSEGISHVVDNWPMPFLIQQCRYKHRSHR